MPTFIEKLRQRWDEGRFVCIGLDSDYSRIPDIPMLGKRPSDGFPLPARSTMALFNARIVGNTGHVACAYKLNPSYYEAQGSYGLLALEQTVRNIRRVEPNVPIILDAARAGTIDSNVAYADFAFDLLDVDAITVNPYLGMEVMKPFLDRVDKGVIVLCVTEDDGAEEFQDLLVEPDRGIVDVIGALTVGGEDNISTICLNRYVAHQVRHAWNYNDNCVLEVATYPSELATLRAIVGDMPILVSDVATTKLRDIVEAGATSAGQGLIVNAAAEIIFASHGEDFAEAARAAAEDLQLQISGAHGLRAPTATKEA